MNNSKHSLITLLLALVMIFTSVPLNAFAASEANSGRKEITDIKTVGDKQVINLGNVRGEKPQLGFFSRSARLFGATPPQAGSSSETVAQNVEINLETLGLNLEEDQFDPSALTEVGSFDVEITFKELGGRTEKRTMTFQAGETKKTETFYLPKDFGNGKVEAEIPKLKDNIALRVYVGATGTTNFNLGQDMTYKFELTQIVHPVIDLKVVDPYGKELQENINQDLGLKLALEEEHNFKLPANTKTFNIRTLTDFAGDDIADLNSTGDNSELSLTTALDKDKRLKVGDKTYKLNKITYNALGQEVEINGQKKKVGGYIEFATQPKIIVPTPDENGDLPNTPDGYKRLSFHAETSANAQDGRFEQGEKLKVIDVLEGTEYTDTDLQKQIKGIGQPTPLINGRVDDNKKFLKWKPELPTTGPVADTDFRPVYLADGGEITPGENLPKGVFEVKVIKDDTIAKDPLYGKSYGVFNGSKLARDKFPDLVAEKGHQNPKWTTEAEDPTNGMVDIATPWTKVITKATTFKATASKLPDIIENPTKPTPEGYVRVTFKAGEGVEDFKDAKTYDVKEGTALTTNHYPTAKAKVGYKDPKWDVVPGTAITSANATITATATKIKDIIPGGPEVKKPEGYYTVEFLEGKHGEFKPVKENETEKPQVTVYYVNPEAKVKMSQITAPTVTAKVGYKFDSWSKEYQAEAVITGDRQITAVYIYVDGVSTEPKDGWTKVTLKSGTKGQFTKTTNVDGGQPKTETFDNLVYYVDPAREVTIPAPVVKATVGNTFTGFDKPLTGTFKTETDINAKYLSTSDVIEDKTPGDDTEKPKGYVTVKFEAGQNGTFAPNSVTKFFVNPEKDVEIGAPGIDPNKNFVFKGFFNGDEKHSSAKKKYAKDVTYTAQYEDKSDESIIPGDQSKPGGWVTISFSAGEHGIFELVQGKQPTISYHVNPEKDVLLKDKAPAIKANDGYKFTKYDPDVETARKYTTEGQVITAQYKAKVVTEDPNDKEHYAKVEFLPGDQGKFEQVGGKDQVTTFWVLKGEEVKFNAPQVKANDGFVFNTWDPILQTKYAEDKTHTAKYEPKSDISDKPVAGFQEVKFVSGKDGKFEGDKTEKSVWVRPNVQVDLTTKAPKVIANKGKVHTGWEPSLIGTFTKSDTATVITAQYKTDADNNGIADETETTDTPTVTARNIGKDPQKTTVEGTAPKGSTVTIKYTPESGQETTKTVTANEQGKYTADITPKLEAGKEVTVTAKDGEKKVSPEVKTQVFDDKDNDGKDDKSQNFDMAKADKIEMVYDPAKMDYLVTSQDGKVKLETKGMVVKVTDKAGVEKKFTAEEIAKDTKNFTVEPADGADLTIAANNGKPIKVTLNVQGATVTEAKTSNLSVKLDADGNGIADDEEKSAKAEDVKALNQNKVDPQTKKVTDQPKDTTTVTGKVKPGSTVVIKDKTGKDITPQDITVDDNGNFTAEVEKQKDGDKVQVIVTEKGKQPSDPAEAIVARDANNDGKADDDANQKTPTPTAKALNQGAEPKFTTITGKAEAGAKVVAKVGDTIVGTATADNKGDYTIEATKTGKADGGALDKDTEVKVTAQVDKKLVSDPTATVVKVDKDGNGVADNEEQFDIKKATKVEIIKNPDKMNYLVNKPDEKAKFETKGLVVKFTDDSGKSATYTAEELANMKDVTIKPANDEEIGLTAKGETNKIPFEVSVNGKTNEVKPNVVVQLDADGNKIADEDEKSEQAKDVKALNQNKVDPETNEVTDQPKDTTTVTGKAKPGSTVIIKNEAGDQIGKVDNVPASGEFTVEVTKQDEGKKVQVVVTEPGKKDSDPVETTVVRDSDNDGEDDSKAGRTERPAAIASNKGKTPTFTTIEGKTEPGAKITVTVKDNGKEKPVTVENLKVNDDGTYTLEAKYNGKPLENGAEILVYATNAPKTKSAPQTTTVFNDFNKDGKPDGGKVDLNDVKDIQVIAPEKMSYTEGDKLNGTGLKAVVRDNKGGIEIFDYDNATGKFKNADNEVVAEITATVNDVAIKDLALTEKDHNGKAIDVKVGQTKASTNQKLEVKQDQTPTPIIEFAANQNTEGSTGQATSTPKQKTTVKFTVKNKPTKVFVKYTVNGEAKEETFEIGADDDATKTVDLQVKLPVGAEVQVLAKDADKTLSKPATAKVVRDADNNGTADDKTKLNPAVIADIKAGAKEIVVTAPEGATELVISETDKDGKTPDGSKTITVKKDSDGNWKIGDTSVTADGDKLTIPKGDFKLDEYNVIKAEAKGDPDTTEPSTITKTVGEAADETAPDKPVVDKPIDGDKDIKVKTPTEKDAKTITVEVEVKGKPGETSTKKTVEVTKGDDGKWKTKDGKDVPEENGKLVIPVDPALKKGDKVTVEVADETGNSSKSDPQEVVAREQLPEPTINPIKTGEKAVSGTAKDATTVDIYKKVGDNYELIKEGVGVNSDGTYNYPGTTEFKDGDVIRVVAKKPGMTEAAAETTVGVDTTALDKAIQDGKDALVKTNDGTPEDKALEKAIKDAEDLKKKTDPKPPTQEELNNAQKEIEKAIENKKKIDEERQKLKDIIEEAEKETQKEGYKDKPGKDRRELEKVIKEGKENLKNNTKITESTTKIEKALEKIRKETVQVGLIDTKVGNQSITITTYPNFCKVKIYINDVYIDEIKTDGFGTLRFTLDKPIESGTTIELKAHKDGYNDDSYWTRVK